MLTHLMVLLGKLFSKDVRFCKFVEEAPLSSRARFNISALFACEVALLAEVEGSKVPCRKLKVFKPSAKSIQCIVQQQVH